MAVQSISDIFVISGMCVVFLFICVTHMCGNKPQTNVLPIYTLPVYSRNDPSRNDPSRNDPTLPKYSECPDIVTN